VFTPEEKFLLGGEISAYDILLFYYGNGNNTRAENESNLAFQLLVFNQRVQKQVAPKLFAGVQYRFTNTADIEPRNNADSGAPNAFLTESRISARERQDHQVSLLGPVLTYDTRDNVNATIRGHYLDLSTMFGGTGLGSDFRFARYQFDARRFQPLFGSDRTILGMQAFGQFHTGDVPFRELGGIGTSLSASLYNNANLMRGIYEQRFRDRQMAAFQAEVRHHLLWRLDAAVFGGLGQVGYKLSDFSASGIKYAGGAGVRFNFVRRDRVNLRLDYAAGTGGFSGIYFSIGESF
jgi:outer membrane protein assembly factor BamA